MTERFLRSLVLFAMGAALFALFPVACQRIPEPEIAAPVETLSPGENTVIWKIRDHLVPGTKITVKAKHLRSGPEGRFRFVVFTGLRENFEYPRPVAESEPMEATAESPWSRWELTATNQVLFIGLSWPRGSAAPIALEETSWANNSSLSDYAYLGQDQRLNDKKVPLRADIRLVRDEAPLASVAVGATSTLILAAGAAWLFARRRPSPADTGDLIAFTVGVIFMYRLWALSPAPFWSWGSYYVSFLPEWLGNTLIALVPIAGLGFLALPKRRYRVINRKPGGLTAAAVTTALVAVAWIFRCRQTYGDWVYGFTNHTHAPLTSAWYAAWESFARRIPGLVEIHPQLVSVALFIPFLFVLFRLVRSEEKGRNFWPVAAMLISGSTLQCFFGEIEVYAVPSLTWLLFAAAAFAYLDGRASLNAPTLLSFVAYLSHVPEALLLFPLTYLWVHELRSRRPPFEAVVLRLAGLAVAALVITALYVAGLYWFRFEGSLAQLRAATTHFGFEVLWGNYRHPGVFMPFFSISPNAPYTRPGPDFVVFSRDNLLKVLAFQFHYSMFFFGLPALILARDRFRQLREPKTAFVFIAFVTYTVYISVAYVGWLPLIRDWDLFAAYSLMGAILAWRLLRDEADARPGLYLAITAVNLLQTLAWIGVNHYAFSLSLPLPW